MTDNERREAPREEISLFAIVKGRESESDFWKEDTDLITVSRLGASFNLRRECKVGRLVCLNTEMPEGLRGFDENEDIYAVWGLVQHCSKVYDGSGYHIGIAFIGPYAPESYLEDPIKTFRIIGMDDDGFWNVGETKAPFVSRAYHRFPCALNVKLATAGQSKKGEFADSEAVTENVSEGGASVFSMLEVETGDAVYFTCEENGFTSLCVVRNRQQREGDRVSIHLEFSDRFPIKDLNLSFEDEFESSTAATKEDEADDESPDKISTEETTADFEFESNDQDSEVESVDETESTEDSDEETAADFEFESNDQDSESESDDETESTEDPDEETTADFEFESNDQDSEVESDDQTEDEQESSEGIVDEVAEDEDTAVEEAPGSVIEHDEPDKTDEQNYERF